MCTSCYLLLQVKSFKRRYPELQRRICDAYERTWLQEAGLVPSGRAELGLTALLSDEVMSLLRNDFPDVHVAVSDLFRQRRFQRLADHQKRQYEAARIGRGEARAELARKRALESASDFNRQLVAERHKERRCYWDLQTMQIHIPQWPYRLLEPPPHKNGFYPVAVIPGQFTEHFVDFSASELAYMPLSKALYTLPPHLQSKRALRQPPPLPTMLRYGNLTGTPRPQEGGEEVNARTPQEANQLNNRRVLRVFCVSLTASFNKYACRRSVELHRLPLLATCSSPFLIAHKIKNSVFLVIPILCECEAFFKLLIGFWSTQFLAVSIHRCESAHAYHGRPGYALISPCLFIKGLLFYLLLF